MTSDWCCSICLSTFSRPEHLRRHAASRTFARPTGSRVLLTKPADNDNRSHICELCGNSFNRKALNTQFLSNFKTRDVLRRHERTCKAQTSPARENQSVISEIADLSDARETKRRCSSADLQVAPDSLTQPLLDAFNPTLMSCGLEPTQLPYASTENDLMLFGDKVGHEMIGMPSPLDFSALDCLLFPGITSDILAAERLEHLAYFTSARGMATFTDRETFLQRQKKVFESYEMKISLDKECKTEVESVDPLQAKSRELLENLQATLKNETDAAAAATKWTKSTRTRCRELFSPPNIRRFLEYFWSLWYPNCPIVHKPLFDANSISPALLCVMVLIGACLSPSNEEHETARILLDSCEELIFNHKCFTVDGAISNDVGRRDMIQCMQASYLVCSLQKREGNLEAQARIRRHRHASMVAHRIGVFGLRMHRSLGGRSLPRKRSLFALTIFHNSPPRIVVSELRMDVACPEACFQADTAEECLPILRVWSGTRFWKKRLSVVSVVRRICQGPIDDALVQEFSTLGTLNLFTLVQAIHSLMFHLHNSLVFESTLAPVQTGLENWRRIWNERIPEDVGIPDTPDNLWKQVGFLRQASEFWHLARIIAGKIMSANQDDADEAEEDKELSRYDHTDMGDVNDLIMEYRRMNLGVD
ncbi:hypothetical protein N7476_002067 [Penicillium atrosanguineum]|uniref:C2H2-type domain-containing protein n=1 Tax=Penicillium atrosanguineum TaxID=1132637 RepID=A0A9W9Q5X4_9EURO|nr:hypothetical protein N7476_002067 [Penicillium atrosanguineum]